MAVIGAAVSVLARRAAEFRHSHQYHVIHTIAQVPPERGNALPELRQTLRKLAFGRPRAHFVDVVIPTANIRERYFNTDVGFDEPRNLLQAVAEAPARISGRRPVRLLIDRPQQL